MQQAELVRGCYTNAVQKAVFLPLLTGNIPFNCKNTYFAILGKACSACPCLPDAVIPGSLAIPFLLHVRRVSPGDMKMTKSVLFWGISVST